MGVEKSLDLSWLMGRRMVGIEKKDWTWFFRMDEGGTIYTEGIWRFVTERVLVTSEDDGVLFGLKEPVNGGAVVMAAVGQGVITGFHVDRQTGDLSVAFEGGRVEFLTTSSGYEGWRAEHGGRCVVCAGGGRLVVFGETGRVDENRWE